VRGWRRPSIEARTAKAVTASTGAIPAWLPSSGFAALNSVSGGFSTMDEARIANPVGAGWAQSGYTYPDGPVNRVIDGYSGGYGDPAGRRVFVHGGGHSSVGDNGLYAFDFNGTTAPYGWRLYPNSISTVADATAAMNYGNSNDPAGFFLNGKPISIHSGDLMWFDPARQRFYRTLGTATPGGGWLVPYTYYYDLNSSAWVEAFSMPNPGDFDCASFTHPTLKKTAMVRVGNYTFCNWGADAGWSTVGTTDNTARNGTGVLNSDDPTKGIIFNQGYYDLGITAVTLDWTGNAISGVAPLTLTGNSTHIANLNAHAVTGFYEPASALNPDACYWAIMPIVGPSVGNTSMPTKFWRIRASDGLVTEFDPGYNSGSSLSAYPSASSFASQNGRHYKRFCFVPEWRAVIFVTDQAAVWALRLP
jgi:hypothetical protein